MTFNPSWLEGSPSLDTSNWLYLWIYLVVRTQVAHKPETQLSLIPLVHEHHVRVNLVALFAPV